MPKSLNRFQLTVLCAALSACAHGPLPVDVKRFVAQRDACDHFRGEFPDPPDQARTQELLKLVSEYCTGTDARLAELRARYRTNPVVMAKLSSFEADIEAKRK